MPKIGFRLFSKKEDEMSSPSEEAIKHLHTRVGELVGIVNDKLLGEEMIEHVVKINMEFEQGNIELFSNPEHDTPSIRMSGLAVTLSAFCLEMSILEGLREEALFPYIGDFNHAYSRFMGFEIEESEEEELEDVENDSESSE